MAVGRIKTAVLSLRIAPGLKKAVAAAAKAQRRSLTNWVEIALAQYLEEQGFSSRPDATVRKRARVHVSPKPAPQ